MTPDEKIAWYNAHHDTLGNVLCVWCKQSSDSCGHMQARKREVENAFHTLNALRDAAYENAVAHGFHNRPQTVGEAMALIHSEVTEAFEAYREGGSLSAHLYNMAGDMETTISASSSGRLYKPIGVVSELADIIIRVLDFSGKHNIDIERAVKEKMTFNITRPHMHGGKLL